MNLKLKSDLPASIVVFLVALPLCLGIALASGAPLLSGVISGIIGGIVVGIISGSHASVSGPAAGLAAVVLTAISNLGSFEVFLMAVVIAGALQLIMGIAKAGFIANYIPSNVIKGLLAAIGILLIIKQIPHAVGYKVSALEEFSFFQNNGRGLFSNLINHLSYFSWGAIIISGCSLLALIYWDNTPLSKIKIFPASLFVVIFGVALNAVFAELIPMLHIGPSYLVTIPDIDNLSSLITLPSFSAIIRYDVWLVAVTIAIVASLETLLNLEAVENIDPHKRQASPNRELLAQGVGNMFSGLVGGIPITSVIVRSSVNINSGAETKLSAILHGVFLLVSILLISPILNLIPLASLACILLFTGYKLAKVSMFKEMYLKGLNQFIPFMVTILAIIFTDLLIGILLGLLVSIFYILKANFKSPFTLEKENLHIGETIRIELPNQVSFLNKASIKDTLWAISPGSNVIIDATYSDFIDNDILEILADFKNTVSVEKNIKLNMIGLKDKYQLEDHIQFVNVLDKEGQQKLTSSEILESLKQGNERFATGKSTEKYFKQQLSVSTYQQNPMAIIVSCIDSRTSAELIFDVGIGDLVSIRIAGNIISKEILGSIEMACENIGAKVIVVMGHSNCGAIASAIHSVNDGNISYITQKIEKAIAACNCDRLRIEQDINLFNEVVKINVENSMNEILEQSDYIRQRVSTNEISLVSAFYDIETGKVIFND